MRFYWWFWLGIRRLRISWFGVISCGFSFVSPQIRRVLRLIVRGWVVVGGCVELASRCAQLRFRLFERKGSFVVLDESRWVVDPRSIELRLILDFKDLDVILGDRQATPECQQQTKYKFGAHVLSFHVELIDGQT